MEQKYAADMQKLQQQHAQMCPPMAQQFMGPQAPSFMQPSDAAQGVGSYVPPVTVPQQQGSYVPPTVGSYVPPVTMTGSYAPPVTMFDGQAGSYVPPATMVEGQQNGSFVPPSMGSYVPPPSMGSYAMGEQNGSYVPPPHPVVSQPQAPVYYSGQSGMQQPATQNSNVHQTTYGSAPKLPGMPYN